MMAASIMVSTATAAITMATPRTKALRTTSIVTSSRAIEAPRHHRVSINTVASPRAAARRRSPANAAPTGNQPAPTLAAANASTETALKIRPMTPRRLREKRMVCTYQDSRKAHPMPRAAMPRGMAASGSRMALASRREAR